MLREEESVAAARSHVYDQFGLVAKTFHYFPHRLRISVAARFSERTVVLMPSLLFFVCNSQAPVALIYSMLALMWVGAIAQRNTRVLIMAKSMPQSKNCVTDKKFLAIAKFDKLTSA